MRARRPSDETRRTPPPPSARRVLALFALGTAAAIAVAAAGSYVALRAVAIDEAKRDTRAQLQEAAHLVESVLTDGVLTGESDALNAVDDLVLTRVLSG